MSWINALTPLQWAVLAAVPLAIISLYFLKLRRQPVEVPSTYLWTRTIEDLHVNSIWQRLRQSLLLFLQLLLVALLILACLRPGWRGAQLVDERMIFLIDNSASMRATDVNSTRLDEAKHKALEIVNQMNSRQVAMVISFSDVPQIEQPFTNSRSTLRQKITRIQPTYRRSDLSGALTAAAGLANPGRTSEEGTNDVQVADALPATLYIMSDGGFVKISDFSLGNLEPKYIRIGDDAPRNVGIVAFNVERNPERAGELQAFARLQNSGPAASSVDVSLYLNDVLIDAVAVEVDPEESEPVSFALQDMPEGVLRLEIASPDDLPVDNRAFAVLNPPRRAQVLLVTPGNDALQFALTTDQAREVADVAVVGPEVLATETHRTEALSGAFDLIIYDQCVPEVMPESNTLFIGRLPPLPAWSAGERQPRPVIIDTDPAHPLTQFVQMGDVRWNYDGFTVQGPVGATVLFDADIGPLLVIGQREGFEDAALGMDIIGQDNDGNVGPKTEWPIRRSFPVFTMNVLRYLGGGRAGAASTTIQPGQPITLKSIYPVESVRVDSPRGERTRVLREGQNQFVYSRTGEVGVYEVREGERATEITQRFSVNLFDARESNLNPAPAIQIEYRSVADQSSAIQTRQELWKWLLLLALLVLAFEWYVYNRRVYL